MTDHVRVLGWLHIVMGVLNLLAGLLAVMFLGGIAVLVGTQTSEQAPSGILGLIALIVAVVMLVTALPGVILGIGLLRFRPWARILGIVVSVLHLMNFPLGTALAVYSCIVLFDPQVAAAFDGGYYERGAFRRTY